MSAEQTVAALSASVIALDGSRRVGWAKSYEAEQRLDDLEREVDMARGDLAILAKFAAWEFGMLERLRAGGVVLDRYPDVLSCLPDSSREEGKRDANRWIRSHEVEVIRLRGKIKALQDQLKELHDHG